ncbi:polysaccharide deacetylase family protein [Muricoccus radiodurans]|uniref:polysaccharide deacetylase family protein n=1 Tax=Muricoccus radiodurans TaxID=2231721 RepID=UPI003CF1138A
MIPTPPTRRSLLAAALAAPLAAPALAQRSPRPVGPFWPNGARLAVSICMMFEADGGQATGWQPGPGGGRFPNFPAIQNRTYGALEGIPRLLDMFDRRGVKVSSFMIGASIERHPELAREIVARGHEGGGRGRLHVSTHWMGRDQERDFLRHGFETLRRVTGRWPKGFNAQGLQASVNTNALLQELGLTYSIDDRSRDEPWIETVNGDKDFCLVPYMGHVNDLNFFENRQRSLGDYEQMLRQEFETLYEEAAARRRMMSVPLHDFVAGHPAMMRSAEAFLAWAATHPGVWFARREEIADWALGEGRALTPRDARVMPVE